jgi:hypothetical protein
MKTLLVYSIRYIPDPRTDGTGATIYSSGVDVSGDTRDYDVDATHISYMIDNNFIYINDFNTKASISSFQLILITNTSIYLSYYIYLLAHVTETKIYFIYTFYKHKLFMLTLTILSLSYFSTYLHLFPFAYIYLYFLPFLIHHHQQTIEQMNIDSEIIVSL